MHFGISFPLRRVAALAITALAALGALAGTKRPVEVPTIRGLKEPNLLSEYERKVVSLEYAKLITAIRSARTEAAADPSLQPLKDALAAACAASGPTSTNAVAAERALAEAIDEVLNSMDGIPAKIKRLNEVGHLLEYDHRLRREQRASAALGRPVAPATPNTETAEDADSAEVDDAGD